MLDWAVREQVAHRMHLTALPARALKVLGNRLRQSAMTRWHLLDLNHHAVSDASQVRLAIIRDDIENDEFIDFSLYTEIKK